jgi:hypothetical protein
VVSAWTLAARNPKNRDSARVTERIGLLARIHGETRRDCELRAQVVVPKETR